MARMTHSNQRKILKHSTKRLAVSFLMFGFSLLFAVTDFAKANDTIPRSVKKVVRKISRKSAHPLQTRKALLSQLTKGKDQAKPTQTPGDAVRPTLIPPTKLKQRFLLKEDPTLKKWDFYSADKDVPRDKTWMLNTAGTPNDPELICTGKPFGYLRTKEKFKDFEFGFDWKYQNAPNGNSGVLVHTTGEDKIWPQAIQIQLQCQKAGSIFPSGGSKSDNKVSIQNETLDCAKWNSCVVISKDGKVTVSINGVKLGEVTGCNPNSGTIALQSEGSVVHFRRIWIRAETEKAKTESVPKTAKKTAP